MSKKQKQSNIIDIYDLWGNVVKKVDKKEKTLATVFNKLNQTEKNFIMHSTGPAFRYISMNERTEFMTYYKKYQAESNEVWLSTMDQLVDKIIAKRTEDKV